MNAGTERLISYSLIVAFCVTFWFYFIKLLRWAIAVIPLVLLVSVIGCKAIDSQVMIIPAKVGLVTEDECCSRVSFVFRLGNRNFIEQIKMEKEEGQELARHVSDDVMIRVCVWIDHLKQGYVAIGYNGKESHGTIIDTQQATDIITEFRFKDVPERDPIALAGYENYWDPEKVKEEKKQKILKKAMEENKDLFEETITTTIDGDWKE